MCEHCGYPSEENVCPEEELARAEAKIKKLEEERLIVANNIAGSPATIVEWSEKVGNALSELDRLQQGNFEVNNAKLLNTVKRAYLKHHCDVDFIGWEDLDKELFDTLCESMGDDSFCAWLEQALREIKP